MVKWWVLPTGGWKTSWQKEKMLLTSIFSLSHDVFSIDHLVYVKRSWLLKLMLLKAFANKNLCGYTGISLFGKHLMTMTQVKCFFLKQTKNSKEKKRFDLNLCI